MSIELSLCAIKATSPRSAGAPVCSRLSVRVILSTGRWRDRKWQVVVRLTRQDILVSVFALVFRLLAFFAGIQQLAFLLLKNLIVKERKGKKEIKG